MRRAFPGRVDRSSLRRIDNGQSARWPHARPTRFGRIPSRATLASLILASGLALWTAHAQTYVSPRLGGGQVAADMVHIDVYYDADANEMIARVDDSYGLPHLRPLEPGLAFDPDTAFVVLTGKAYNAQYGWNAGGFFSIPAGAAIWIELIDASPGLEAYEGWGRTGSHTPILGTAGSPHLWQWSGVMMHNTYAVLDPVTNRFFAEYRVYFGDAASGSREGFLELDDAQVRLEWTATPVPEPFRFGAGSPETGAPLVFVNADHFTAENEWVMNFTSTNADPSVGPFGRTIPMVALPATTANGGPIENHAALGSCVAFQIVSLAGPPAGRLSVWNTNEPTPLFTVATGALAGTNRLAISQNQGAPGTDPYGRRDGWRFTVDQAGLYRMGFCLADTSINGPTGNPVHSTSDTYYVYLQAGVTMAWAERQGRSLTAVFGGEPGRVFRLERSPVLGSTAQWQTVAGPLLGTNRLQRLTHPDAANPQGFYRLRRSLD